MTNKNVLVNRTCYKVVELSTVTDHTIENVLNKYVNEGWLLDQIQFVVREASRRPSMAFIIFVRNDSNGESIDSYSHDKYNVENEGDIK